ncbi:MAG TPA: hypothetical protein VJ697_04445 [Nitrososphaeraceae archaeon]|nr:hypothetical protein [Nitrososphaeraceae archaeon]
MKGFSNTDTSRNICEGLAGCCRHGNATLAIDSSAVIDCLSEGISVGLTDFISWIHK